MFQEASVEQWDEIVEIGFVADHIDAEFKGLHIVVGDHARADQKYELLAPFRAWGLDAVLKNWVGFDGGASEILIDNHNVIGMASEL